MESPQWFAEPSQHHPAARLGRIAQLEAGWQMSGPDIYWEGKSGREYGYWIHPIGTDFKDEPGNYIYAKETSPKKWQAVFCHRSAKCLDHTDCHDFLS